MSSSSKDWTFLFQEQQIHKTTKGQNTLTLLDLMEQRNDVGQCGGMVKALATCFTRHSPCLDINAHDKEAVWKEYFTHLQAFTIFLLLSMGMP